MAEIRAFLFDMDGVIVDSNPVHRMVWEEYNRSQGLETTEAMHQRMYGKRNDEIVRDFYGGDLVEEAIFAHGAAKESLYREWLKPNLSEALVPGLKAFLNRYARVPKAVATNAEPANVDFILKEAGIADYFRATVNGHQVTHPKPHPEVYLKAAELLGVPPANCLVFEDSRTGVQAALAAGMPVIGVSTTHNDLAGVELHIRSFDDPALEAWLKHNRER